MSQQLLPVAGLDPQLRRVVETLNDLLTWREQLTGNGLDADTLDGLDSADFAQVSSGSFTGALTGMSGSATGQVNYRVIGNLVVLMVASNITDTSNANSMTLTGMPAELQPNGKRYGYCTVTDNGLPQLGSFDIAANNTTITFSVGAQFGFFTTSGTKGLPNGFMLIFAKTT